MPFQRFQDARSQPKHNTVRLWFDLGSFRKKRDCSFLHWEALAPLHPCISPSSRRSIDGACWLGPLVALNCSVIFFNVWFQICGWHFRGLPVWQGKDPCEFSDDSCRGVGLSCRVCVRVFQRFFFSAGPYFHSSLTRQMLLQKKLKARRPIVLPLLFQTSREKSRK